jgi:Ras-related protein Rab-1A
MQKYNAFKILIIGDSNVGKSSLLIRFSDKEYCENYITTIGLDFRTKKINIDNKIIRLEIWDAAGQERFKALTKLYYRNCYGVLLVFDITDKNSFINIENWINEFNKHCDIPNVSKILIGNKCDLISEKKVSYEEINKLCLFYNLTYIETSAKDNTNVELTFNELAKEIIKNYKNIDDYKKNKLEHNSEYNNNYYNQFCIERKC